MASITIERTINVPHEKVWAVVEDFTGSPGPSVMVSLEKGGDAKLNGAGAERTITIGGRKARERLESMEPPHRFTYSMISGAPVKDYLGKAEFTPSGGSTVIRWTAAFTPRFPGSGWMIERVIKKVINGFIDELARIK